MADQVKVTIQGLLAGKKRDDDSSGTIYTGTYDKFDLKVSPGVDLEDYLTVYTDPGSGKVAGVAFGNQILPFVLVKQTDASKLGRLKEAYKRGLQGRLTRIMGEKPKGFF